MICRCDCASCSYGAHAECYYTTPHGDPECKVLELVARALHCTHFHPDEKSPRMEQLYRESHDRMLKEARAAVRAYEDHAREERKAAAHHP